MRLDARYPGPAFLATPGARVEWPACTSTVTSGDNGDGYLEYSDGTATAPIHEVWDLAGCDIDVWGDTAVTLTTPGNETHPDPSYFDADHIGGLITTAYDDYRLANPSSYATGQFHLTENEAAFYDVDNQLTVTKTGSTTTVDPVTGTDVDYVFDVTTRGSDNVFDVVVHDDTCTVEPDSVTWYWSIGTGSLTRTPMSNPDGWPALITNSGDVNHNGFLDGQVGSVPSETWRFACTSTDVRTTLTNVAYATSESTDTWCPSPEDVGADPITPGSYGYGTGTEWTSNYATGGIGWDLIVDRDFMENTVGYQSDHSDWCLARAGLAAPPAGDLYQPLQSGPVQWTVAPGATTTTTTAPPTTTSTSVPTTVAPTTVAPTTVAPTTVVPTTIARKTVPRKPTDATGVRSRTARQTDGGDGGDSVTELAATGRNGTVFESALGLSMVVLGAALVTQASTARRPSRRRPRHSA